MSQNVAVNFRVSGSELSSYIDSIQRKSDKLTDSAIHAAMEQATASKDQLKIINDQISAIERKNRIEASASRSIAIERRDAAMRDTKSVFEGRKNDVYADGNLSEKQKKEKITAIEGSEKSAIEGLRNDYHDQLATLREQERQAKIQTTLSREQIQTAKDAARENVKTILSGDKTIAQVIESVGQNPTEEEKLTLSLIQTQLDEEKRKKEKGNQEGGGILGSLMTVDTFNKFASGVTQLAQTNNGFDSIQAAGSSAGRLAGGILGAIIGGLVTDGIGAAAGAGIGSSILGELGGDGGALIQKQAMLSQENIRAKYRYYAMTGMKDNNLDVGDMSEVGINATDFLKTQTDFAKRRGYASDSNKTARDATYLERGYGVDQGTSGAMVEVLRSSKEGNRDLAAIVTGILQKGQGGIFKNGDNTFLGEFTNKFITLQKELLKNNTTVATGTTMDILSKFNSLGGMFAARDSRSAGLISSIDGSLSNPGSDNMRAIEFSVLRGQMPGAGVFDLRREMQKGLGSPGLLKGMLGMVDSLGGSHDARLNNLSGMFPGLPLEAIENLYNGYKSGKLSKFDTGELKSVGLSDETIRKRAEENTAPIDKITAANINKTLAGEPLEAAVAAISEALKESLSGAVIQLDNGKLILLSQANIVKDNDTRKAGQAADAVNKATAEHEFKLKTWHK